MSNYTYTIRPIGRHWLIETPQGVSIASSIEEALYDAGERLEPLPEYDYSDWALDSSDYADPSQASINAAQDMRNVFPQSSLNDNEPTRRI